ncbi:methyl-CpG-binding domain protein 2 [Sarotherodon galilaeus]
MYDPQSKCLTVLCECREKVNTKAIPLDILADGSNSPWRIIGHLEEDDGSVDQLVADDWQAPQTDLGPAATLQASTPEAIIRAVGDLLQNTSRPASDHSSYWRLRTFSGVIPTPPGEEQLENWILQARLMIEEYDRPDREKKIRIMESVKGPALEILQAVRFNNPEATPQEYIDVIENTFDTPETGEELYFAFRMLCQHRGEKLSEFLRRMERSLSKVVKKGGLSPALIDKARLDQLIKGATGSDLMLLSLRLRERKDNPPTFLQLLNEVRIEEEHEASRRRLNPNKAVHVKSATVPTGAHVENLRLVIQGLKTQVNELTTAAEVPGVHSPGAASTENAEADSLGEDKNLQALKKEVVRLRKQISVMSVNPSKGVAVPSPRHHGSPTHPQRGARTPRDPSHFFCYRCGEDGHVSTKCKAPENYPKVIQKFIQAQRKQGESNKTPSLEDYIGGKTDFHQYIWGLSESETCYPYRGYIQIELGFPEETQEKVETIPVLALVCPDPRCSDTIPVLVGTNVHKIRPVSATGKKGRVEKVFPAKVNVQQPQNLPTIKSESAKDDDSPVANVKWTGPGPLVIPAGKEHIAVCKVKDIHTIGDSILITERAASHALPPSVLVQPTVLFSKMLDRDKFLVLMRNQSLKDTAIPMGTVVAHLHVADIVTDVPGPNTNASPKLDPSLFNFGDSPIPAEWKQRLSQKLAERGKVFSTEEWDVGLAKGVQHHIRLVDHTPFRERSRRVAPADLDDLRRHLQGLLAAGIIRESRSPYASPIVLARKKTGRLRMCVDYRTLNRRTVPDQYTVPRIDEALDCLSGSRWFSVLDLRSGYYQIPMAEEDKEKTAFICPLGFFQFERMPQGITGAPATFQRVMEKAVGDMHMIEVIVYLDDLIVFGRTLEEHEQRLIKVLDRLEETGLKLSIDKCQFCRPQVTYVGHIVSEKRIATDPTKVEAVARWEQPTDLPSLQSFLGFCGYCRRFIKDYSIIVKPLTELCRGYPPTQKGKRAVKVPAKTYHRVNEPFGDRWDAACTGAFQNIIHSLTNAPVLAFADPTKPYVLHIDASLQGLGAVLNQEHPEGLQPVAFASRKLSSSEKNYPVHQLEFLALKWAVVDKFHDYLYGAQFTVRTDNNPLTYILTTAKLNATGHRWLAALATYDFTLQYRPGSSNIDADALLRNPLPTEDTDWQTLPLDGVKALCKQISCGKLAGGGAVSFAESLGVSPEALPECFVFPTHLDYGCLAQISKAELITAQDNDPVIAPVKKSMHGAIPFTFDKDSNAEAMLLQREANKLVITDGVLYRKVQRQPGREIHQLVLPREHVAMVLRSLHDESGHLGVDKTVELIRDRFYWPRMSAEVEQYIRNCGRCVAQPDSQRYANVLVVTDHFTRYAQAFPAKDQKASTVAKILCERYFVHYGLPARIHSDQGRDFESKLIHDLLRVLGIRKSRTTPYHPQGDPQPERFNRTLLSMLGTLDPKKKQAWNQSISHLVHAYNCTQNEATGYSPYLLMFGREARLPVDICFGTNDQTHSSLTHHQYIAKLKADLQQAYRLATEAADKSHQRNKKAHDKHVKEQTLAPGDRVLLKNFGVTGKHKLKNKWRTAPYVVLDKMPHLPVYRVKPEKGLGVEKTVHRNHLLPIGYLVRLSNDSEPELFGRPVTRSQRGLGKAKPVDNQGDAISSSESESEDACLTQFPYMGCENLPSLSEQLLRNQSQKPNVLDLESSTTDLADIERNPDDHNPSDLHLDPEAVAVTGPEEGTEESGMSLEGEEHPVGRPQRLKRPVPRLSGLEARLDLLGCVTEAAAEDCRGAGRRLADALRQRQHRVRWESGEWI